MVTEKQIIEKYGEVLGKKILSNRFMQGITVRILPNGEHDIPQRDIDVALKDINGRKIEEWELD